MAIYIAQMKPMKEGKKLTADKLVGFQVGRLQEFVDKAYRVWAVTGVRTAREARKRILNGVVVYVRSAGERYEMKPLLPTWENGEIYKIKKEE